MNPFTALSRIQQAYLTYVHTFQMSPMEVA
jgi:hypothetical protein